MLMKTEGAARTIGARSRFKLSVLAKHPGVIILAAIFLLYMLPALCGFGTWPNGPHGSDLIKFNNVWDTPTFGSDHRPIREFVANEVWAGRFPLWLPTQILGLPLLEQYEYQIFNPLEWLTYFGGDLWWTVVLCGYLFVGGLGMQAICTRLGAGSTGAIGGAIAYVTAGWVPLFYSVPSWAAVIPIIPWMLYCATIIATQASSVRHVLGLWICLVLLLLSGQPQIILCTAWFVLFFAMALVLLRLRRDFDYRRTVLTLSVFGSVAIMAVATAAPQIIPFMKFVLSADAFTGHPLSAMVGSGWRLSAVNFLNLMFPFSMGLTPYDNWTHDASIRASPSEDFPIAFYCTGSFLTLLGIAAAFRRHPMKIERIALACVTIFALATIALYGMLQWPVWPFGFVNLARYSCPVLAGMLAVCIGIGIDDLPNSSKRAVFLAGALIAAGTLALVLTTSIHFRPRVVTSYPMLLHVTVLGATSLMLEIAIFCMAMRPNNRVAIAALVLFAADTSFQIRYGFDLSTDIYRLAPLLSLTAGALLYYMTPSTFLIPIFACAAMTVAGWIWYGTTQAIVKPPIASPSAALFKGHRVASSMDAYLADSGTQFGVVAMGSKNPIEFKRLQEFLFAPGADLPPHRTPIQTSVREWSGFADVETGSDQNTIQWSTYCVYRNRFNALGADVLIGWREGVIGKITSYPGCESGLEALDVGHDRFTAYRDTQAAPRAYFTSSCIGAPLDDVTAAVHANIGNLTKLPIVETPRPPSCPSLSHPTPAPRPLQVSDISSEIVDIDTSDLPAGLVVLNDQFFPLWSAYADGQKIEIYRTNSVMRGVFIPAGTRLLRFIYEPQLKIPLLIAAAGIISMFTLCTILRRRRRYL